MDLVLSTEEKFLIGEKLNSLGFNHVELIIASAFYIANNIPDRLVLADLTSPVNIEYYFEFKKNENGWWVLFQVQAILQSEPLNQSDAAEAVSKEYNTEKAPIPQKSAIDEDIRQSLEKARIYCSIQADRQIQEQLQKMGFPDFALLTQGPTPYAKLTILIAREPFVLAKDNTLDRLTFEFMIASPPEPCAPYIFKINIYLDTERAEKEVVKHLTVKSFCRLEVENLTKEEMIRHVLVDMEIIPSLYNRIEALSRWILQPQEIASQTVAPI